MRALVATTVLLTALFAAGCSTEPADRPRDLAGITVTTPDWQLQDIQPESARFEETYGLTEFRGRVLVVTLVEGYCSVCRGLTKEIDKLAAAMTAEGYDVQFALLGDSNASDFVNRSVLPLFRDPSAERAAWTAMEVAPAKQDTFVYDRSGVRTLFWEVSQQSLSQWPKDIRAAVEAQGK